MARVGTAVASLLALAVMLAAIVFLVQRSMLFPAPRPLWARTPPNIEVVWLQQPSGPVESLFLPARPETIPPTGRTPLLIFFHGNAELVDHWVEEFAVPRTWGWSVLLVEYPGYGRSSGAPSERAIHEAARAAHRWALRDPRVDGARIVAYGRSLGGGAAARLAVDVGLAGLILESSFTSVRPLAARMGVPGVLVRDPFDNLAALGRLRGRLLVIHGRHDTLIPIAHARQLAAAAPGAELHELACGHNDCARPWSVIHPFLRSVQQ